MPMSNKKRTCQIAEFNNNNISSNNDNNYKGRNTDCTNNM